MSEYCPANAATIEAAKAWLRLMGHVEIRYPDINFPERPYEPTRPYYTFRVTHEEWQRFGVWMQKRTSQGTSHHKFLEEEEDWNAFYVALGDPPTANRDQLLVLIMEHCNGKR